MELTPDGEDAWDAIYDGLSEGAPGVAGAMLCRGEAQVRRLACIYALLDHHDVVDRVHLEAAVALWEYAEASVKYIFGAGTGDSTADDILEAVKAAPEGLTKTQISNLFGRNKPAAEISKALAMLLRYGLLREEKRATGGRPMSVYLSQGTK